MAVLGGANRWEATIGDAIRRWIGEEAFMESYVAQDVYDEDFEEGLEQGRREALLELAASHVSEETLEELRTIEDLETLKRRVSRLLVSDSRD